MSFTAHELNETSQELIREIGRLLSKPTEPDVLLGNHPLSVFASQKQSIAIWHGRRIENHLAAWVCKCPDWKAKAHERIVLGGNVYEVDNLAWNCRLGLVVAIEAKRVWANQDKASQEDVRQRKNIYTQGGNSQLIAAHVGQMGSVFRHFVFDVYGRTDRGRNGLSIIAGDKIECVFGPNIARYIEWEQRVMANALLEKLDQQRSVDHGLEQHLRDALLSDVDAGCTPKSLQEIIDFIDQQG